MLPRRAMSPPCAGYPSPIRGVPIPPHAASRGAAVRPRPPVRIEAMLSDVTDTPESPGFGPHRHLPESRRLRHPFPAETEIVLTGADLSIGDVEAVARAG